jgi:transposase
MMETRKRAVGIDLAKRTMEVRFLKDGEKARAWNCKTDVIGREKLYAQLTDDDIVGIEACSLAFVMAREIEAKTKAEVVVLNPGRLAIIYKSTKKTDSEDAMKIARLLLRNPKEELPVVPIPSEKEERDRAIVKELGFLKAERTKFINRLHSRFLAEGITTVVKADIKREARRNECVGLLHGIYLAEAKRILMMIEALESQIEHLEGEQIESLQENELTPFAMSVPGVGPSFALAFLGYVGDGRRFSRAPEVSNYVGIVPKVDQTGETARYGHITKIGCVPIRRVAIQSAWALVRSSNGGALKAKFYELADKRGKRIAITATARKLVELVYTIVKKRCYYWEMDPVQLDRKLKAYKLEFKLVTEGSAA